MLTTKKFWLGKINIIIKSERASPVYIFGLFVGHCISSLLAEFVEILQRIVLTLDTN